MFKIGEFSKLTRIPVRTLRYYDDIGLFKAAKVDSFTGYRYYTAAQLPQLNRILALKDLGLSLEQIANALDEAWSEQDLQGMLRLKQFEIEQHIQEEAQRLSRIKFWLDTTDNKNIPTYEIVLKDIPAQTVAGLQAIAPNERLLPKTFEHLFTELSRTLAKNHVSCDEAGIACYLDEDFKDSDIRVEAFIPINKLSNIPEAVMIHHLPAMTVASVAYCGETAELPNVYTAMLNWMAEQSYRIDGYAREIHLENNQQRIIEVQIPVKYSKNSL